MGRPDGVPLIYSIYHLYIEPLLVLNGAYLALFHPKMFLDGTTPPHLSVDIEGLGAVTPLVSLLLSGISGMYVMLMIMETTVLRLSDDVNVWRAVIGGILACDLGHVHGLYNAMDRALLFNPLGWNTYERINISVVVFGVLLRLAFLLGIGFSQKQIKATKKA